MVANGTFPLLELEEFLPYRLAVLSSIVWRTFSKTYVRHGLDEAAWLVLMALGEIGPTMAKTLGVKTRMHKTKVSRAVAELLKRELVARRPNQMDLREAFLQLTPQGRALYEEYAPLAMDFVNRLGTAISAEEQQVLERSLARLAEKAKRMMSDPFDIGVRQKRDDNAR